jgi:hypothetical protein
VLAGVADSFPDTLWDRLLPQTEITLNLLRQSNATPTVSAYAHLCGPFDYNRMPLAPMGCEVQIHEKTDKRSTWAYHCVDGWYLNTSPEHYRVHNCHIKTTKADSATSQLPIQLSRHMTNSCWPSPTARLPLPDYRHPLQILRQQTSITSFPSLKPSSTNHQLLFPPPTNSPSPSVIRGYHRGSHSH